MITINNLACRRGGRLVFQDINSTIPCGTLVLVKGANGAGKSTFLRILAGLILPSEGEVRWQNVDITADPTVHNARLHYVGHLDAVKPELTVGEMLNYWCVLRGAGQPHRLNLLKGFLLDQFVDYPIRSLSAGQKRRLSLSRLLRGQAPLWLLDEPTTTLDQQGRELLYTLIQRQCAAGGIVITATHDKPSLPDTQQLEITIR